MCATNSQSTPHTYVPPSFPPTPQTTKHAEVPGYKALLLDRDTMRVCSTLFGRTELAEHSVVHVERLDAASDATQHLELKVYGGVVEEQQMFTSEMQQ